MNNTVFGIVSSLVSGISFPKHSPLSPAVSPGKTIEEDEYCLAYEKIILGRKKTSGVSSGELSFFSSGNRLQYLSAKEKFLLYNLICFHFYDMSQGIVPKKCEKDLRLLSNILQVSKNVQNDVATFFNQVQPFFDRENSIYFSSTHINPLVQCRGINVQMGNLPKGEIIYLKYIKEYNIFLSKSFHSFRKSNCINELIQISEFNIVDAKNFNLLDLKKYTFEKCLDLIRNFGPFNSISVPGGETTPEIILDAELSQIRISGHSTPLSPTNYFDAIFDWMKLYETHGKERLDLYFRFDYYNTYTSKFLLKLFATCRTLMAQGKKIKVYWIYAEDDDELLEFGQHLETIFKNKFFFRREKRLSKVEI